MVCSEQKEDKTFGKGFSSVVTWTEATKTTVAYFLDNGLFM